MGLRLTGLPTTSRYPDVAIELTDEVLDLLFSGTGPEHAVQVPLGLLGDKDHETTALELAAKLKEMGYTVTLRA